MSDFDFESFITDIPDYPEPGVVFKDITPLFADANAMRQTVLAIASVMRALPRLLVPRLVAS